MIHAGFLSRKLYIGLQWTFFFFTSYVLPYAIIIVIVIPFSSFLWPIDFLLYRYITLEVKNILLESVSHHILPQLLSSPFLQRASDLVRDYLKFMDDHLKESADLACLAYRHRTYSKVSIISSLVDLILLTKI
jgi:N-terminal acetyltransferase B complex non-catalytic subunit